MKKTYHLCLSAGNEIMFRDLDDYHRGFNCFAIALYKTNSAGLVESFMSTHMHLLVQTDSPKDFMMCFRLLYTTYFNKKYGRSGKLGERLHFTMEVVGYHHLLAAMSYILRMLSLCVKWENDQKKTCSLKNHITDILEEWQNILTHIE